MLYKKENKKDKPALFTAADFLAAKKIKLQLPKTVILSPSGNLGIALKDLSPKRYNLFGNIDILGDNFALVSDYGLGAPMTAIMTEVLTELGVNQFILLGCAGALAEGLNAGDIIICNKAFCDEGISPNYTNLPTADADEALTNVIKTVLPAAQTGAVWTSDALFRETPQEAAHYASLGALAVEMEAAALFSIAKTKNLKATAVLVISDLLTNARWQPCFGDKKIRVNLIEVIKKLNAYFN